MYSLVFLPASIIAVLKNGSQLIFLAIISAILGKQLPWKQWFGIGLTLIGLVIISLQEIYSNKDNDVLYNNSVLGIILILLSGFIGAIRNYIEELILHNLDFHSDFLVGLESIISSIILIIVAIFLILFDPFKQNNSFKSLFNNDVNWQMIVFYFGFIISIYGKETMQMKVTKLSTSLTRKLFEVSYPWIIWCISIIIYYVFGSNYGQGWDKWSYIQLFGLIIIICGIVLYMKNKPKKKNKKDTQNAEDTSSQLVQPN